MKQEIYDYLNAVGHYDGWQGPRNTKELDLVIEALYDGTYDDLPEENHGHRGAFSDGFTRFHLRYDLARGIHDFGTKDRAITEFRDHFTYKGKGYSEYWANMVEVMPDDMPRIKDWYTVTHRACLAGTWTPTMLDGKKAEDLL